MAMACIRSLLLEEGRPIRESKEVSIDHVRLALGGLGTVGSAIGEKLG